MKKGVVLFFVLLALVFAPRAFAQETVWDMAKSDRYGKKLGGMLGRGVINVATSFVDIVVQTVHGTQDGPPFIGTLTGLGGGIGCGALRLSSGALDVLTSWVPGFNGIPVSRSYSNCLEAEEEAAAGAAPAVAQPAAPGAATTVVSEEAPVHHRRHHNAMDYVKK